MTHGGSGRKSRRRSRRSKRKARRSVRRTTRRAARTVRRSTRRAARVTKRAARKDRRTGRREARRDRRAGRKTARQDRRDKRRAPTDIQTLAPTQTLAPQTQTLKPQAEEKKGFIGKKLENIGANIGKFKEKIKGEETFLGKVGAFVSGGGEREPGTIIQGTLPIGGAGAQAGKGLLGKLGKKDGAIKDVVKEAGKKLQIEKQIAAGKRAFDALKKSPTDPGDFAKVGSQILKKQGLSKIGWLKKNKWLIGLGAGFTALNVLKTIAEIDYSKVWLASDNIVGGASIAFMKATDGIAFNDNITKEYIQEAHKNALEQMDFADEQIQISAQKNPFLYWSKNTFLKNTEFAKINLSERLESALGQVDEREAKAAEQEARDAEFAERREEDIQREEDISTSIEEGRKETRERDTRREEQAASDSAFFAALRKLNQGVNLSDEEKQILIERGYDPRGGGTSGGSQLGFGLL